MDLGSFHDLIIKPSIGTVGLDSIPARVLLLGTALIESELTFLEQKGPGKAKGFYQMEEKTYQDILRYLNRYERKNLKERCLAACFYESWPPSEALIHNLRWATLMCRLKYWMQPQSLPAWDDAQGMAEYHKKYYNTAQGKTDVDKSEQVFNSLIIVYNKL